MALIHHMYAMFSYWAFCGELSPMFKRVLGLDETTNPPLFPSSSIVPIWRHEVKKVKKVGRHLWT